MKYVAFCIWHLEHKCFWDSSTVDKRVTQNEQIMSGPRKGYTSEGSKLEIRECLSQGKAGWPDTGDLGKTSRKRWHLSGDANGKKRNVKWTADNRVLRTKEHRPRPRATITRKASAAGVQERRRGRRRVSLRRWWPRAPSGCAGTWASVGCTWAIAGGRRRRWVESGSKESG